MSTLFAGATTAAVVMGGALEFGMLVGASWLSRPWSTAFPPLRWAILAMVVALMGLNAMGCYGDLTRAHLQSQLAGQIDVDGRATPIAQQIENKTAIVADLNRRIGQIDSDVEEATRRGRSKGAMDLAAQQTRARPDLLAQRQVVASELADLRVQLAAIDVQRQRVEAEVGPVSPSGRPFCHLGGGGDCCRHLDGNIEMISMKVAKKGGTGRHGQGPSTVNSEHERRRRKDDAKRPSDARTV